MTDFQTSVCESDYDSKKADWQDLKECFVQLEGMVPTVPKDKNLTHTQLLQHVIDYIWDLELVLNPKDAKTKKV